MTLLLKPRWNADHGHRREHIHNLQFFFLNVCKHCLKVINDITVQICWTHAWFALWSTVVKKLERPTFMRLPSCKDWAMDLAMVSKKNQEYYRKTLNRTELLHKHVEQHERQVSHLLFNYSTTTELMQELCGWDRDRAQTLSSLLLVLKSAVCLRVAVTAVASTSWVVAEFPEMRLLVTNTY